MTTGIRPSSQQEKLYLVEKVFKIVVGSLVRQTRDQCLRLLCIITAKRA